MCRKISGPHVCGDALDIEPFTLSLLTGSWRQQDQLEVGSTLHSTSQHGIQCIQCSTKFIACIVRMYICICHWLNNARSTFMHDTVCECLCMHSVVHVLPCGLMLCFNRYGTLAVEG